LLFVLEGQFGIVVVDVGGPVHVLGVEPFIVLEDNVYTFVEALFVVKLVFVIVLCIDWCCVGSNSGDGDGDNWCMSITIYQQQQSNGISNNST
jgi:hypothetical protein